MSFLRFGSDEFTVKSATYEPSYIYEGASGFQCEIPAYVAVKFEGQDVTLHLRAEDAEKLMYALAVTVLEHAVAQKVSAPKAVA